MPKSLNSRSGLAIVGTAVGPDGHRFEVLQEHLRKYDAQRERER